MFVRSPNGAPQTASPSTPISAPAKVVTIGRSQIRARLGQLLLQPALHVDTGSCGHRVAPSDLWPELNEDHSAAVSHHDATLTSGNTERSAADATQFPIPHPRVIRPDMSSPQHVILYRILPGLLPGAPTVDVPARSRIDE